MHKFVKDNKCILDQRDVFPIARFSFFFFSKLNKNKSLI